jgi:hypothetical protein
MKKLMFLLISVMLLSCKEQEFYQIQPELAEYVNQFYTEGLVRGFEFDRSNLIVRLDSVYEFKESSIGIFKMEDGQRVVLINSRNFKKYNYTNKKIIVFHELGHALLNRSHTDNEKSIMYPHIQIIPLTDKKEVIDELFNYQ